LRLGGASAETWAEIASESDKAARAELLSGSPELAKLERLTKAADEARRLAAAKNAEVARFWNSTRYLKRLATSSWPLVRINGGFHDRNRRREISRDVIMRGRVERQQSRRRTARP